MPVEYAAAPAKWLPGGLNWHKTEIGPAASRTPSAPRKARITNVQIVDFDDDGVNDVLVCDPQRNAVLWYQPAKMGWNEHVLARDLQAPAHATLVDLDADGDSDVVVSELGDIWPSDELIGRLVYLENTGANKEFRRHLLLDAVRRVADAQPGDFDGDGDLDLAVAVFGYARGEVLWLENRGDLKFREHRLWSRAGAIHVPVLKQLFSGNDETIAQTDIVMLLTPHIVRGSDITESDLKPIYIGSNTTFSLGGQPPLLAPPAETPAPGGAPGGGPATATPQVGQQTPQGTITVPAGSPVPGTVVVPNPPPPAPTAAPPPPVQPPPQTAAPTAAPLTTAQVTPSPAAPEPPITSPGIGSAQVIVSPPAGPIRVGQGPYNIPLSITGAQRLSMVTLTLTFDPRVLRVRSVQDGSFLRSGGANVTFTQQVNNGRIDITISRASDATGVSGTGLLAAILFDAIAPGTTTLTASGTGTGPGNTPMGLQFRPVTLTVQ